MTSSMAPRARTSSSATPTRPTAGRQAGARTRSTAARRATCSWATATRRPERPLALAATSCTGCRGPTPNTATTTPPPPGARPPAGHTTSSPAPPMPTTCSAGPASDTCNGGNGPRHGAAVRVRARGPLRRGRPRRPRGEYDARVTTAAGQALDAKLYVIPGSHPAMAARRMLELKGIPYKRVDLMPVISARRPAGAALPLQHGAVAVDRGAKLTGSREIAHELDRLRPEPPLYPSDEGARAAADEAEALGRGGAAAGRSPHPLERPAA